MMTGTRFWKFDPERVVMKQGCSPAICWKCTSVSQRAEGWRFEPIAITDNDVGGLKEASVMIQGTGVFARMKFEKVACIVYSVFRLLKAAGAFIHRRRQLRFCLKLRKSISISVTRTYGSKQCVRKGQVDSTSTQPIRLCGLHTCQQALSSASRTKRASTKTKLKP